VKSLFGKPRGKKRPSARQNVSTVPLSERQIKSILSSQTLPYEPNQLAVGCGQSIGRQREHNEDSLLTFTMTVGGNGSSYLFGLYIVADGMGGHQHGEVASGVAARTLASYILRKLHPFLNTPSKTLDESLQEIMQAAFSEAQRAVTRAAPGSGTTLTAALVLGQQVTIAHIGDTRVYIIHPDGRMEALTRDHSLVKRLEELGQLTSQEAALHPHRNVLYRALGQGEILEPDIFTIPFPQPGFLLLCSDGLWGVVSEEEIFRTIMDSPNVQRACQNLIAVANSAGGPDNISVVLTQLLS